jgi:D-glycero-D-manno-heptose 1,7-bisphosphate phosphatase
VRPAVFLDRDGTINREVHYLSDPAELELLPGAAEAIARLGARFFVAVVTNQAGISRGYLDEARLQELHGHLDALLSPARIDAYYHCPHHPTVGDPPYRRVCDCRKPAPGMIEQACREHGLEPTASYVIGDKLSDLAAGRAAGCRRILVLTGYGAEHVREIETDPPDYVAADLAAAADWILTHREETA